ncbi:hypothetical protein KFL_002010040 [Klebsormidium nitens]|uniref:Uncharacterized protein n=1 Tax=Klebsormidium nitens TaxID=105231 RepID=A0A0U9HML8_KLENI|nr:hypothetical protein KFL_002010040 [Klebsormidium nitens]|eukprot:GAQ84688.1 hypothetical protein KFL_002010040 [Klebsormidium nitens]
MAGFFKRFKDFFSKPAQEDEREDAEEDSSGPSIGFGGGVRQGFSVKRAVPAKGGQQPVVQGVLTDGGIQGLNWYAQLLRQDEDGDIAHEFLRETAPRVSRRGNLIIPSLEIVQKLSPVTGRWKIDIKDGNIFEILESAWPRDRRRS